MKYRKEIVAVIIIIAVAILEAVGLTYLVVSNISATKQTTPIDHYEGQIFRLSNELMGAYDQIDALYEQIDSIRTDKSALPEITPKDRRETEIEYLLSEAVVVISLDSLEVCLQDPIFGFVRCKTAHSFHSDDFRTFYQ